MSSGNVFERLWKLLATANKLVHDGKRDAEALCSLLQSFIEQKSTKVWQASKNQTLRIVEGSQGLVIPACDGKNFLAKAKEVFKSFIDGDFTNWKLAKASHPTKEVAVEIYEMAKDASFVQIFGSIASDLNKLCFTQHQIEAFCKVHHEWLRTDGYGTFFLFKENEQYFVARVLVSADGLHASVYHLGDERVWRAVYAHRLVVLQRAL